MKITRDELLEVEQSYYQCSKVFSIFKSLKKHKILQLEKTPSTLNLGKSRKAFEALLDKTLRPGVRALRVILLGYERIFCVY